MQYTFYILLFFLFSMIGIPLQGSGLDSCRVVRIAFQWHDQSQFAGYYMAQEKGFFAEEGLNVELLPITTEGSLSRLQKGEVDFATTLLLMGYEARAKGVPLELVVQTGYHSNFALMAWKKPFVSNEKPILAPTDLEGKKISVFNDFKILYTLFFLKNNVRNPIFLPQYQTISLFLWKGVSACSVTLYNERHLAHQRGVADDEITVFKLRDYGIDFPEDGLYCLSELAKKDPELVQKTARAVRKGWLYAKQNPEETLREVMRVVHRQNLITNEPHMRWMLRSILEANSVEDFVPLKYGELPISKYHKMALMFKEYTDLRISIPYETFVNEEAREKPVQ